MDYALSALSLDGARRGALTYCDGQARGESAPGSHNSTSTSISVHYTCSNVSTLMLAPGSHNSTSEGVSLILVLLAPSLESVDSILVLMVVLLVPIVVRCGALLSPGVQPTLSHGQRSGV